MCDPASWKEALTKKNWVCEPSSFEEALDVQSKVTKVAEEVWGPVIGWKVALTSEASRRLFGGGPTWGPLFQEGLLGDGSVIELSGLSDPLLEPELFYCDGKYYLAFEVPDNRFGKKWEELNWLMLTADLAGSYKVVLSSKPIVPKDGALVEVKGPNVSKRLALELGKVSNNMELLKDKDGCKLLGTIAPMVRPENGEYVLSCCGADVRVTFV